MISNGQIRHSRSRNSRSGSPANSELKSSPRPSRIASAVKRLAVPALTGLVLLTVLSAGGIFSASETREVSRPNYLEVSVVQAVPQSEYEVKRSYLGKLESARSSRVGFELGGKLISVLVDEGDLVQHGDVLAELDTELLHSQLETLTARIEMAQAVLDELVAGPRQEDIVTAKANVERWRAQLKLAQISKNRMVLLQKSRSVSEQETEESVYDEQTVAAQLAAAESQLQELVNGTRSEQIAAQRATLNQLKSERNTISIQIKKSQLLAPYSGIVASRMLDEGEVIRSGQPVFELFDNGKVEARIGVPVGLVQSVLAQPEPKLIYADREISAELKSVRPEKNSDTRTVDIVFIMSQQTITPSIGDIVRLEIAEDVRTNGFWIPTEALVETYRGLWGCYVAQRNEPHTELANISLRELELLHQEEHMSFVRGALRPGEQVIVSGTHRLVSGQTVRLNAEPSTAATKLVPAPTGFEMTHQRSEAARK